MSDRRSRAGRRQAMVGTGVAAGCGLALIACLSSGALGSRVDVDVAIAGSPAGSFVTGPLRRAVRQAGIVVPGDLVNQDCRTGVCKHNENTDLTRWRGAVWLSPPPGDVSWPEGFGGQTDIWQATILLSRLPVGRRPAALAQVDTP